MWNCGERRCSALVAASSVMSCRSAPRISLPPPWKTRAPEKASCSSSRILPSAVCLVVSMAERASVPSAVLGTPRLSSVALAAVKSIRSCRRSSAERLGVNTKTVGDWLPAWRASARTEFSSMLQPSRPQTQNFSAASPGNWASNTGKMSRVTLDVPWVSDSLRTISPNFLRMRSSRSASTRWASLARLFRWLTNSSFQAALSSVWMRYSSPTFISSSHLSSNPGSLLRNALEPWVRSSTSRSANVSTVARIPISLLLLASLLMRKTKPQDRAIRRWSSVPLAQTMVFSCTLRGRMRDRCIHIGLDDLVDHRELVAQLAVGAGLVQHAQSVLPKATAHRQDRVVLREELNVVGAVADGGAGQVARDLAQVGLHHLFDRCLGFGLLGQDDLADHGIDVGVRQLNANGEAAFELFEVRCAGHGGLTGADEQHLGADVFAAGLNHFLHVNGALAVFADVLLHLVEHYQGEGELAVAGQRLANGLEHVAAGDVLHI